MMEEKYIYTPEKACSTANWTTTHTKNTMTHCFENGYTVTVYWNLKKAYKQLNDKTDSFEIEGLSLKEYYHILLAISKQ